VIAYAVDAGMV